MRLSGRLSATMKREFSAATLRLWLTSWEPCGDFQP
nr:MAG TPA: hypothetical protein [Caudoviricetes sp.]DAM02597.1 MAG TPA: hypothetical protein [Caudoviricetes sp.]DAO94674.1 MAG TPA: hypothetical protein [Caudoviricetes sp.]DAZ51428.1 MAG TPA: hypothetical protein [Caudoviricetes sp.]